MLLLQLTRLLQLQLLVASVCGCCWWPRRRSPKKRFQLSAELQAELRDPPPEKSIKLPDDVQVAKAEGSQLSILANGGIRRGAETSPTMAEVRGELNKRMDARDELSSETRFYRRTQTPVDPTYFSHLDELLHLLRNFKDRQADRVASYYLETGATGFIKKLVSQQTADDLKLAGELCTHDARTAPEPAAVGYEQLTIIRLFRRAAGESLQDWVMALLMRLAPQLGDRSWFSLSVASIRFRLDYEMLVVNSYSKQPSIVGTPDDKLDVEPPPRSISFKPDKAQTRVIPERKATTAKASRRPSAGRLLEYSEP